ncbi:MAG: hypothetical protein AB7D36_07745 [Oscillospiraceae bacterium]
MKKQFRMHRRCFPVFILAICIVLTAIYGVISNTFRDVLCDEAVTESGSNTDGNGSSETVSPLVPDNESQEIVKLDTSVTTNSNNEAVFTISIDDFIASFNGFYWQANGSALLRQASEWISFTYNSTAYSNYETRYYRFKQDEKNYVEPAISVYVPTCDDRIQAVTLDFDDHGYTEWAYSLYVGYCYSALKVFFPDFTDDQIRELYETLYGLSNDSRCFINDDAEPEPNVLYHHGDIGIYPYYGMGMVHICLIPITQQFLDDLTAQNVEIHDIDVDIS